MIAVFQHLGVEVFAEFFLSAASWLLGNLAHRAILGRSGSHLTMSRRSGHRMVSLRYHLPSSEGDDTRVLEYSCGC